MIHWLKTHPVFWKKSQCHDKDFEVRKDDREPPYAEGDTVMLMYREHRGKVVERRIKYILRHEDFPDGLQPGYCVLGLEDAK